MRQTVQGRFAHVECEESDTGTALTEEGVADADWFCSQVCRMPCFLAILTDHWRIVNSTPMSLGQVLLASSTKKLQIWPCFTGVSCLQGCKEVHTTLASRTNHRQALDGHFSVEVVRYSRDCKGKRPWTMHNLSCTALSA